MSFDPAATGSEASPDGASVFLDRSGNATRGPAQARGTRDGRLTLMHGTFFNGKQEDWLLGPENQSLGNTMLERGRFLVLGLLVLLAVLFVGAGVLWYARNRTGSYNIIMRGGR